MRAGVTRAMPAVITQVRPSTSGIVRGQREEPLEKTGVERAIASVP